MLILPAKYPYKVEWKRLLLHLKDEDTEAQKDEAVPRVPADYQLGHPQNSGPLTPKASGFCPILYTMQMRIFKSQVGT